MQTFTLIVISHPDGSYSLRQDQGMNTLKDGESIIEYYDGTARALPSLPPGTMTKLILDTKVERIIESLGKKAGCYLVKRGIGAAPDEAKPV